jgi:hypothetical protein
MADMSSRERGAAVRHSRARRAGESAFGLLLLTRQLLLVCVVALLVAAGVWASWDALGEAAAHGGRGTLTVARCSRDACTGSFVPSSAGAAGSAGSSASSSSGARGRDRVVLRDTAGAREGARVAVALRPGTDEVVRTGRVGLLRACLPLGGALLLAAVVLAGGLRVRRTAWVAAAGGLAVLAGSFVTV